MAGRWYDREQEKRQHNSHLEVAADEKLASHCDWSVGYCVNRDNGNQMQKGANSKREMKLAAMM